MKLLLIGPPGSGKGTQGAALAERLGIEHLAAGDLLRDEVKAGTDLGREAEAIMRRGDLVPDRVIIGLVLPRVQAAVEADGYLLDGFPRTVEQAVEARRLADSADAAPDAVVYLDVPRKELMRRILARAKTEGREDDNEATVENRLRVFDEATHPLVDHYRERGILHVIAADRPQDEVTRSILDVLPG